MELIKLKKENLEAFAELWIDKNFQKLVEVLRVNQENYGKRMLMGRITRENCEGYREFQDIASAFSIVIKIVEDSFNKVNNIKRRKKHDGSSK